MRRILLLAALTVIAPTLAQAQSQAYRDSGNAGVHSMGTGDNCGTPDEWKPCPPLPKHPLQYYRGDRDRDMR